MQVLILCSYTTTNSLYPQNRPPIYPHTVTFCAYCTIFENTTPVFFLTRLCILHKSILSKTPVRPLLSTYPSCTLTFLWYKPRYLQRLLGSVGFGADFSLKFGRGSTPARSRTSAPPPPNICSPYQIDTNIRSSRYRTSNTRSTIPISTEHMFGMPWQKKGTLIRLSQQERHRGGKSCR